MDCFYDIPGFDGVYKINKDGCVYSIERYVNANKGGIMKIGGEILSNWVDSRGYYRCKLKRGNNYGAFLIHRLLAITFIDNPNNYPLVRHLNDVKIDNRLENLCWGTKKDNAHDSIKNGTFAFIGSGGKNHMFGRKDKLSPIYGKSSRTDGVVLINKQTDIFYETVREAAYSIGMSREMLNNRLLGVTKNNTGFVYV